MSLIMNTFPHLKYSVGAIMKPQAFYPCQGLNSYKDCAWLIFKEYTLDGPEFKYFEDIPENFISEHLRINDDSSE